MTGLEDLFELYSPSDMRAKVYVRKLAGLRTDGIRRAVASVLDSWDRTSMPPVGLIRRQYHHEMALARNLEEAAERRSRSLPDHQNTPAEMLLFALILELAKRRVLWSFARSRWVGASDPEYGETWWQDYGSMPCQQGRAGTLQEARAAWARYAPGEPEPPALRSAGNAVAEAVTEAVDYAQREIL